MSQPDSGFANFQFADRSSNFSVEFPMTFDPDVYDELVKSVGAPPQPGPQSFKFTFPSGEEVAGTGYLVPESFEEFPANWWERLKQWLYRWRIFKWLQRRFPVKMLARASYSIRNWKLDD